jgi:hypothetical protein
MKNKEKRKFPTNAVKDEVNTLSVRANHKEVFILGLVTEELKENSSALNLNPYVALKYFKSDWQCFSDWEQQELKEFSSFLSSLQRHTWEQVYNTGSRIPKHGLAYSKYDLKDVKPEALRGKLDSVKKEISEEINFFELRVNQNKLRVHGFQSQSVFFLIALDRNHEAFPM